MMTTETELQLDVRQLELKATRPISSATPSPSEATKNTCLILRNLPAESSEMEAAPNV